MEEEYIKMMCDAVDFIKETKIEATKYYNYINFLENVSQEYRDAHEKLWAIRLESIDTRIKYFRKYHICMFADYTLARRFINVYFSEVESLLDDLHDMEPDSSMVSLTLGELASKLDSCKDYILRNGNRTLPF